MSNWHKGKTPQEVEKKGTLGISWLTVQKTHAQMTIQEYWRGGVCDSVGMLMQHSANIMSGFSLHTALPQEEPANSRIFLRRKFR